MHSHHAVSYSGVSCCVAMHPATVMPSLTDCRVGFCWICSAAFSRLCCVEMGLNETELSEVIIENPTGEDFPCGISVSPKNVEVVVLRSDEMHVQGTERTRIKSLEQAGPLLRPADSARFVPALMWSRVD